MFSTLLPKGTVQVLLPSSLYLYPLVSTCARAHTHTHTHTHTHRFFLSLKAAFIRTSYLWLELRNRWPLHSLWLLIHCLKQQELLNSAKNVKWKFNSAIITTTQFTLEMSPMLQKWPLSIPYSHLPFAKSKFCLANTSSYCLNSYSQKQHFPLRKCYFVQWNPLFSITFYRSKRLHLPLQCEKTITMESFL